MKLIILNSTDTLIYNASTPAKEDEAYRLIFKELDEFEVYVDLDQEQEELYNKASNGDLAAIKRLLKLRRDYEYEEFYDTETAN